MSREKFIADLVDDVGEALGVDTGCTSEARLGNAVEAATKVVNGYLGKEEPETKKTFNVLVYEAANRWVDKNLGSDNLIEAFVTGGLTAKDIIHGTMNSRAVEVTKESLGIRGKRKEWRGLFLAWGLLNNTTAVVLQREDGSVEVMPVYCCRFLCPDPVK